MINDQTPELPQNQAKPRDTIEKLQQLIGFGNDGSTAFADLAKIRMFSPKNDEAKKEISKFVMVQGRRQPSAKSKFTVAKSTKSY